MSDAAHPPAAVSPGEAAPLPDVPKATARQPAGYRPEAVFVTTLAAILVLYPLSIGPLSLNHRYLYIPNGKTYHAIYSPVPANGSWGSDSIVEKIYFPLMWVCANNKTAMSILKWYLKLFGKEVLETRTMFPSPVTLLPRNWD